MNTANGRAVNRLITCRYSICVYPSRHAPQLGQLIQPCGYRNDKKEILVLRGKIKSNNKKNATVNTIQKVKKESCFKINLIIFSAINLC